MVDLRSELCDAYVTVTWWPRCVPSVFRCALSGMGGDGGGRLGSRKEQRRREQLHSAAVLLQE